MYEMMKHISVAFIDALDW